MSQRGHGEVVIVGQQYSDPSVQAKLYDLARMPHVKRIFGMPDLHMASPCPIGTSAEVDGHVYCTWIGDDIGCGVALYRLEEKPQAVDADELASKLESKFEGTEVDSAAFKAKYNVKDTNFDSSLGTIGGGNHFAEVMALDNVYDPSFGELQPGQLYLCVHTGSRDYGADVQRQREKRVATAEPGTASAAAAAAGSDDAAETAVLRHGTAALTEFMAAHDHCVRWARCNRRMVAERFCKATGLHIAKELYDVTHNFVENRDGVYIHRKGSIPTTHGPAMIPGSRGTASYLVSASGSSLHSLPHGAGRTLSRTEAKQMFADLTHEQMTHTAAGSRVVCNSDSLLRQEHPDCYKDIDAIADTLRSEYGVNVVARFTPVCTIKM